LSLLEKLLQRITPLILGVGQADHENWRSDKNRKVFNVEARRTVLRTFAVLAILLFKLGRKKEEYMNEAAFGVGQLLSLADTLHKDYCIAVRGGSLPPSLIGNSMMAKALDNPCLAVADLADRMRIYMGWAKTAEEPGERDEKGEEKRIAVREARKTLRLYKPIADRLHVCGLPEKCDDVMRAEVLLGYLANTKEEKKESGDE